MATDSDYLNYSAAMLNAGANVYAANMGKRSRKAYVNLTREMAAYNNEMAEKHWQMANEYNSPAAQMMRYKEAGLNPNLIYNNDNSTGLPATPSAEVPNIDSPVGINPFSAAVDAVNAYQNVKSKQIANTNAAIVGNLNQAKAENEVRKGIGMDIANEIAQKTADYKVELMSTQVASEKFMYAYKQSTWLQQEKLKVDKLLEDLQSTRVSRRKNQEEITNLLYTRRMLQSAIELNQTEMDSINAVTPARVASLYAGAGESASRTALNRLEYQGAVQTDPFTGLPLYKLDARNRSGYYGYQAVGQRLSNNLTGANIVNVGLKNKQAAYDYTTRYLNTFGKIVGIATKAAVPFVGGALLGKSMPKAGGSFKGSGLYDANGHYYAP